MSKEEILKDSLSVSINMPNDSDWFIKCWMALDPSPSKARILNAMDEFAKETAIAFGRFLLSENVRVFSDELELDSGIERTYSPTEAYNLFLKFLQSSKQKK